MKKQLLTIILSLTISLSVPGYALAVTNAGSELMQDTISLTAIVDKAELSAELTKFQKTKANALSKMYVNYPMMEIGRNEINVTVDISKLKPAVCVEYGTKKTTEADKVFLKETYYSPADKTDPQYGKWESITIKACESINKAQSYLEINEALKIAKTELLKLIPTGKEDEIHKLQNRYIKSLEKYKDQAVMYKDSSKYSKNPNSTTLRAFDEALKMGIVGIQNAGNKADIEEAYLMAQETIDDAKTDDYLLNLVREVNNAVMSLPKLESTSYSDLSKVMNVYDTLVKYSNSPGTDLQGIIAARTILQRDLQRIINVKAKDITDISDTLDSVLDSINDDEKGNAVKTAFFSDAKETADVADELKDIINRVNNDSLLDGKPDTNDLFGSQIGDSVYRVANAIEINGDIFWAQIDNTVAQVKKADKSKFKPDQIEYAINCYEQLTELQQYIVESEGVTVSMVERIYDKL